MTLSPEQFNKIALKEDIEELRKELEEKLPSKERINDLYDLMDGIANDLKKFEQEKMSNLSAHDRIQTDVNEVRKHVGMDIKNPVLKPQT